MCLAINALHCSPAKQYVVAVPVHLQKAFVAGRAVPSGNRMVHEGTIISGGKGTATEKVAALEAAGIIVAPSSAKMGDAVVQAMKGKVA